MGTIANSYPGCPLDGEDSFRVIEIQQGERDEPVTVRLVTTSLRNCPPYEALSYAWGDLTQTELIQVVAASLGHDDSPEAPLSVTIGCADALRRLRSGTATRTLWVDSICINQSFIPERNQQLRLMPRIYSSASRVVIYLGESSGADGSDAVMDWLHEIYEPSDDPSAGHVPEPDLTVLRKFLRRRWFRRVWVLQEVRLAREAMVVCGDREVAWDAFRVLRDWQENSEVIQGPHRSWALPYTVRSLVSDVTDRLLPPYPARLLQLLVDTRNLGATDVRDKLFAILPLLAWESDRHREALANAGTSDEDDSAGEEEEKEEEEKEEQVVEEAEFMTPECDYERPPAALFIQLARDLINAVGLHVLYCAATPLTVPALPSWAPDWGAKTPKRNTNWLIRHPSLRFIVDTEPSGTWHFSDYTTLPGEHGTQLHVSAAWGGTIARIGDVCDVYADNFPMEQWEGLCDPVHLSSIPGPRGDWTSRFFQVLFENKVTFANVMTVATSAIKRYNLEKSGGHSPQPTAALLPRRTRIEFAAQDTALVDIFQSISWYSFRRQAELIFKCCHTQRLFVTDAGYLGLAPEAARVGDRVMAIKGLGVPFVVRSEGADGGVSEAVRLLGTCYREELKLKAEGWKDANHPVTYEERVIR